MITAWRMTTKRHAKSAFSGEGAKKFGGRWNHTGTPVVYAAGTLSLTVLELLVHNAVSADFINGCCSIAVKFDESLCRFVPEDGLPKNWKDFPAPIETKDIGADWINVMHSAVLAVPGVITPSEWNYIINPKHKDFKKITIGSPEPFRFDPRLLQ